MRREVDDVMKLWPTTELLAHSSVMIIDRHVGYEKSSVISIDL